MIIKSSFFTDLCIKEISGNITEEERKLLEEQLIASEKHRDEYAEIKRIWTLAAPKELDFSLNPEKEWRIIENNLSSIPLVSEKTGSVFSSFSDLIRTLKLRPAFLTASLIIIATISFLIFSNTERSEHILQTATTSKGERVSVTLPDGSIVKLNNESEISFYEPFKDDQRKVNLTGEAFFDVRKDEMPFLISTGNALTRVMGTKFNVWARDNETRVIVKEGSVSLVEKNMRSMEVLLHKSETSRVIDSSPPTEVERVNADRFIGWLDNKLTFNRTSLSEVLEEVSRTYDKNIIIVDNNITDLTLTGTFNIDNIESNLDKICLALDLSYKLNDTNYTVFINNKN
jgi:ferric-dicitrate binding protein FerR (iron transport regulator)